MQARADYNSRILEFGGEYKYDLNARNMNTWHISPYANVQLSQLWQDGYTEKGAGIFGHRVGSQSNTYFAGGLGLEFKRYLSNGSYAMRLGVKHAFAGADPKFTYGYIGNDTASYELKGQQVLINVKPNSEGAQRTATISVPNNKAEAVQRSLEINISQTAE